MVTVLSNKQLDDIERRNCNAVGYDLMSTPDIAALLRDVRRLRAVVEQYADHNNWTNVGALRDFQPSEVDIWTLSEPGYTRAAEYLREDGE
jgi:hypothetical protein